MRVNLAYPRNFLSNAVAVPFLIVANGCAVFLVSSKDCRVTLFVYVGRSLLVGRHPYLK